MGIETIVSFALGLIFGSFFNVCIVRIPRGESLLGRSQCRHCQAQISWYDNIPLLSFLLLGGKCRFCKQRISLRYPVIELASGAIFAGFYWKYGLGAYAVGAVVFFSLLLIISAIDLEHRIIPDVLSLGGLVVGAFFAFVNPTVMWWESLLGIVLGGGIFLLVATFYEKMAKQEGLGGGDIKLLAMIGAWLGYQSILPVVLISSAAGSLVGVLILLSKKGGLKSAVPFGPFLALGAAMCAIWGAHWVTDVRIFSIN